MFDDSTSVQVSRRIEAPAARIFDILADPQRHTDLDGSSHFTGEGKMLQGAVSNDTITGVGDIFVMKMNFEGVGDYVMQNHVVEYERNRRIGWEPAPRRRSGVGRWQISYWRPVRPSLEFSVDP
jgi:uncharacterized protein YndB with AHSA1/START domain